MKIILAKGYFIYFGNSHKERQRELLIELVHENNEKLFIINWDKADAFSATRKINCNPTVNVNKNLIYKKGSESEP